MAAITAAILAAGAVTSAYGGFKASQAAKGASQASQNIAGLEEQQNQVRKQQMELTANRNQMEILRNAQRSRSLALNNATSQGAQFGSGLSGGYGQIAGQTGINSLGISQNLALGEQNFGLDTQISGQKISKFGYESQQATDTAIAGFGKTISGLAGPIGNLGQGFNFGSSASPSGWGGGRA